MRICSATNCLPHSRQPRMTASACSLAPVSRTSPCVLKLPASRYTYSKIMKCLSIADSHPVWRKWSCPAISVTAIHLARCPRYPGGTLQGKGTPGMADRVDWSREEVEACVADYLRMLALELNGQRYSKSEHAKALMPRLNGRSRASVEFKHANISAVMLALGYPYIEGYKPRANYQAMLVDAVEAQLALNDELQAAVQAAVLRPAITASAADPEKVWVP